MHPIIIRGHHATLFSFVVITLHDSFGPRRRRKRQDQELIVYTLDGFRFRNSSARRPAAMKRSSRRQGQAGLLKRYWRDTPRNAGLLLRFLNESPERAISRRPLESATADQCLSFSYPATAKSSAASPSNINSNAKSQTNLCLNLERQPRQGKSPRFGMDVPMIFPSEKMPQVHPTGSRS